VKEMLGAAGLHQQGALEFLMKLDERDRFERWGPREPMDDGT
jgi:hypothetical protein